jgi:flagellar biosynthetic protein FlhB
MPELFETQERTEEATPKRREEARERGQFARSSDLSTAVVLLVTAGVLVSYGPSLLRSMSREIVVAIQRLGSAPGDVGGATSLLRATLATAARLTGPFLVFAAAAGTTLHVVQAGGLFVAREAFGLKFEKLDPTSNLARMLSLRSFVKVGGALLKLAVVVGVLWLSLRGKWSEVAALAAADLEPATSRVGALLLGLFLRVTGALLVVGAADWFFQRWQHGRDLRMTKQQVKDEHKNEDGDPAMKRRIRDRMRSFVEKPLAQAIREATVVVANPTHFAVALDYVEGRSAAPTVVAKGADALALEIRRLARESNVPVVEQPPLARALFRDVPVGQMIPEKLYRAVAAVLAIVWRLREERRLRNAPKPAPKSTASRGAKSRAASGGSR